MKNKRKTKKSKQKAGHDLETQPPAELTDEQLQQVVGGGGLPSTSIPSVMPTAGDEVLVSFESGDPIRPIIIGKIWNG